MREMVVVAAVAVLVPRTRPDPVVTGLVDLGPEPAAGRLCERPVLAQPLVVLRAQALAVDGAGTPRCGAGHGAPPAAAARPTSARNAAPTLRPTSILILV